MMTHYSTPRHIEILPYVSLDIVPYYNQELGEERTGIVLQIGWLTENLMWEWM